MNRAETEAALRGWRAERRPEALGDLLKAQRDRAFAIALRLTGSPADAEDAVQDAFVKMMSRTQGFEDAACFERAVVRAVVQCALDGQRRRRQRAKHESPFAEWPGGHAVRDARDQEREEARALLRQAVQELPENERVPVVLCYYQGMAVAEAARTLDLPRETLRARLARALASLRTFLLARDRRLNAGAILLLLWEDGTAPAPPALCAALDAALPGQACAGIPPAGPLGTSAAVAPAAGAAKIFLAVPALTLAAVLCAAALMGPNTPSADGNVAAGGSRGLQDQRDIVRQQPLPLLMEEPEMKKTVGALVLAGGMLLPVAHAGEPNPDAAQAIEKIEQRRMEKESAAAEAATKAAANPLHYKEVQYQGGQYRVIDKIVREDGNKP